jgi:nitrate reductase alpha subunit
VKQGTDAALAMAMGHVILKEFHVDRQAEYFRDYVRQYTDMPMLVRLVKQDGGYVPERFLRASDFDGRSAKPTIPNGRPSLIDETTGNIVAPQRLDRLPLGRKRQVEPRGEDLRRRPAAPVACRHQGRFRRRRLPLFRQHRARTLRLGHGPRQHSRAPGAGEALALADGETLVATVHDLFLANYGVDRGFGGDNVAKSYDEDTPYTPAWAEKITGVPRDKIIQVAREFATNAEKTRGRSMVIIGAAMNHWYHADMNYRGVINMLVMCGCVGQSGGGWSHYVGQEKLRPQAGWAPLAFALDWGRPPRQQNSTSAFYAHTDQWRYETIAPTICCRRPRRRATGTGAHRLQHPRRADGLAAVRAAAARPTRCSRRQRQRPRAWSEGLRRQGAEGRRR